MMQIAAPFFGEFGWEVSLWAPWLRWQMKQFTGRDLHVFCRAGHEYLYEDFAHQVYNRDRPEITKVDCQNAWINGERIRQITYVSMCQTLGQKQKKKGSIFTPLDLQTTWHGNEPPHLGKRGIYHRYGKPNGRIGIAIHARGSSRNPERNWSAHKWDAIAGMTEGNLCSVGHPAHSIHVRGTEDLRGLPLKALCELISCSQVVIGPSSGPLALAMLCNTPVVWWSPNSKDVPRFETLWNPFHVEQTKAADTWDPDVIEVEAACQKFL